MEKIKYLVELRLSIGEISPEVKKVEDSINKTMRDFGFDETMYTTSVLPMELSVNRRLTPEEQQTFKDIIVAEYGKKCKHVEVVKFDELK
jgi:hypothetical protein